MMWGLGGLGLTPAGAGAREVAGAVRPADAAWSFSLAAAGAPASATAALCLTVILRAFPQPPKSPQQPAARARIATPGPSRAGVSAPSFAAVSRRGSSASTYVVDPAPSATASPAA